MQATTFRHLCVKLADDQRICMYRVYNAQTISASVCIRNHLEMQMHIDLILMPRWFELEPRIMITHAAAFSMMFSKYNHSLGNASNNFSTFVCKTRRQLTDEILHQFDGTPLQTLRLIFQDLAL